MQDHRFVFILRLIGAFQKVPTVCVQWPKASTTSKVIQYVDVSDVDKERVCMVIGGQIQ